MKLCDHFRQNHDLAYFASKHEKEYRIRYMNTKKFCLVYHSVAKQMPWRRSLTDTSLLFNCTAPTRGGGSLNPLPLCIRPYYDKYVIAAVIYCL